MGQKLHFLTSIKLKMKIMNKLLLVLFCGISFYSSGQSDSLIIKGELKGLDSGKVYMSLRGENGKNVNYSTSAKKGKFSFKVKKQTEPVAVRFSSSKNKGLTKVVDGRNIGNPPTLLDIFVFNTNIEIKGIADEIHLAEVKGGRENNDFAVYRKFVKENNRMLGKIRENLFYKDGVKDSTEIQELIKESSLLNKKEKELQKEFIKNHPSSFGSLFLLSRMENLFTAGDYETIYNNFREDYKYTSLAKGIEKRIEFLSPTAVGKPAIQFIKKDKDGNTISLEDYKGKLVLLDFWGSWCSPCRASHPHLKELYKEYKDKDFEIIAIANEVVKSPEEQRTKWLEAIEKDGIPWVHVLNNDGQEIQDLVKDYRITGFPTKILLDKDGKILLRVTASATDDIDKMLEKKLSK